MTDCAGPLPRHNYGGEFLGWGSDIPSLTKLVFGSDGSLSDLKAVASRKKEAKPRFAVALDYIYILKDIDVVKSFKSIEISKKNYLKATSFKFILRWEDGYDYLNVANMAIYYHWGNKFDKVTLSCTKRSDKTVECVMNFGSKTAAERFRVYACDKDNRTVFESIKFVPISAKGFSQYDYGLEKEPLHC